MAIYNESSDAPLDPSTPYHIAPGDTFRGTLQFGDLSGYDSSGMLAIGGDVVRIDLVYGAYYEFTLTGRGSNEVVDPFLLLFNSSEEIVAQNDDIRDLVFIPENADALDEFGDLDSYIGYAAPYTGRYYIAITGYDTGGYELQVTRVIYEDDGDAPADFGTQYSMRPGDVFRGTLLSHDTSTPSGGIFVGGSDYVRIGLVAGTTYQFSLEGSGTNEVLDPVLFLHDSNGNRVAFNDDAPAGGLDSFIEFTPASSGTYYIDITGWATGDYELQVTEHGSGPGSTNSGITRTGGPDNDSLSGGAGNDVLSGLGGNDVLWGEEGNDRLVGGSGSDHLFGGPGNDTLEGGRGEERLEGGRGDDALYGGRGSDTLLGGSGNDNLYGDAGADRLDGGSGADRLDGGGGRDLLNYGASSSAVTVNLATRSASGGHAQGDTVIGFENVAGSAHDDRITGQGVNNELFGGDGNDILVGGGGSDRLDGGEGNDRLDGGNADDNLIGGRGHDTLVTGRGRDTLSGGAGNDRLDGGRGNDFLDGGGGTDVLLGGAGIDRLFGGSANDRLSGGAGNDRLHGGTGADRLTGGLGGDVFVFGADSAIDCPDDNDDDMPDNPRQHCQEDAPDVIVDFTDDVDRIDLRHFNLSGFGEVNARQVQGNVRIDLTHEGGRTILLRDFDIDDLGASDFLL